MEADPMTDRSCPSCGSTVPADASICPECSAIVPVSAVSPEGAARAVVRPGAPGTAPSAEGGVGRAFTGGGSLGVPASPPPPSVTQRPVVRHRRLPVLFVALAIVIIAGIVAVVLL